MTTPTSPQPAPSKTIVPNGMLAITTYGSITAETVQSLVELTRFNERNGLKDVIPTFVMGGLVDKARNEAVRQMLATRIGNQPLGWIAMIDADMTFPPNTLDQLLATAYIACPWADVVGGWCPLRGKPYLPTTDLGSGQWEAIDAGNGPVEVIRTGAACLLIKRHVFERMLFPWFGVRPAPRAIDVLTEFDNYVRTKMDGRNPFRQHDAWPAIERCATEDAARQRAAAPQAERADLMSAVGEDSNFCDKVKALGMRIAVNTDLVLGHVDRHIITVDDHRKAMQEARQQGRLVSGVLS